MTAQRNRNIISLTAIGLLLLSAILFVTNTGFAITVKGIAEMLYTGNHRSLQMLYHSSGSLAPAFSAIVGLIQTSSMIFKPYPLVMANVEYFGEVVGYMLTFAGGVLGTVFLMGLGYSANLALRSRKLLEKHEKLALAIVGLASFIPFTAAHAAFIVSGAIGMDFRKTIAVCAACQLASLIIFSIM